ncbi:MAG: hypothetical protein IKQ39_03175 [Oscillospiraceae bacterium]|nr:hypothetical protein [Oscillospiraceae bacterium]
MKRFLRRLTLLATAWVLCMTCMLCALAPADCPGRTLRASAAAGVFGIDVSKYQERIDWKAAAEGGVKFAIIRVCKIIRAYDDWEPDERFEENYKGAKEAGIAVGAYMYTDAANAQEFTEDVDYMLKLLDGKGFELPVFLDMESASRQEHLSPKVFMPAVLGALERIEEAGYTAGVYSSTAFFSECIDRKLLQEDGYAIWEANYFNTVNGLSTPDGHDLSDEATIWQYSGCGRTPGVKTTVDCNICYTSQYFNPSAVITNSMLPNGVMKVGSHFDIAGNVSSDAVLRSITGEIYAADNPSVPLQSVTVNPYARSYKLTGFFTNRLDFSQLPCGYYALKLTAVDSSDSEITVSESLFTVTEDGLPLATETVPPQTTTEPAPLLTDEPAVPAVVQTAPDRASSVHPPHEKKNSGFARWWLGVVAWIWSHIPCRSFCAWCASVTVKLSLERTPLHRIFARLSRAMEIGYLSCSLGSEY